ncbi:MAG: hypothetical protein MRY79_02750 [Alphaproteobacteria bacterium]|nr:hypothetical protein [Alphaproteobacteria bacterium]
MTTLLPKDADNNTIPALRLRDGAAHTINVTATSARNSTAFSDETKVISLYATDAVFIECGDNTVSATSSSHYFPAGVYYDIAISGGAGKGSGSAYIAAIAAGSDCTLYISEKE